MNRNLQIQPVLVVGGGIAGLATAHALAQAGQPVQVWEQARDFTEIGAGLQVTPNAFAALDALGLKADVLAVCHRPPALQMRSAVSGRMIFERATAPIEAQFQQPYAVAHRAALHGVLLAACRANPLIQLQTGRAVAASDIAPLAAERAVIGADGLHSVVRRALRGEQAPVPSGFVAYRALLPLLPTDSPSVQMWAGPGRHLVRYPVNAVGHGMRHGVGPVGEPLLNVVAFFRSPQQPTGWNAAADPVPLQAAWQTGARGGAGSAAGAAAASCPEVLALLARATEQNAWRSWAVMDRAPDAQPGGWTGQTGQAGGTKQNLLLVGDAAHPMLPFAAQGANLALEDAATLGQLWAQSPPATPEDVARLFSQFETLRHTRAARVQALARRNRVLYHASGPLAWARDLALAAWPPARRSMDWVYGWGI